MDTEHRDRCSKTDMTKLLTKFNEQGNFQATVQDLARNVSLHESMIICICGQSDSLNLSFITDTVL